MEELVLEEWEVAEKKKGGEIDTQGRFHLEKRLLSWVLRNELELAREKKEGFVQGPLKGKRSAPLLYTLTGRSFRFSLGFPV